MYKRSGKNLPSQFKVLQTEENIDLKDLFLLVYFKLFPHHGAKHWWPVFICSGGRLTTPSRF